MLLHGWPATRRPGFCLVPNLGKRPEKHTLYMRTPAGYIITSIAMPAMRRSLPAARPPSHMPVVSSKTSMHQTQSRTA